MEAPWRNDRHEDMGQGWTKPFRHAKGFGKEKIMDEKEDRLELHIACDDYLLASELYEIINNLDKPRLRGLLP